MADEMDLDPQLRDFLEKSDMLKSIGDDSGLPIQQLRQQFEGPYKYEVLITGVAAMHCLAHCRTC